MTSPYEAAFRDVAAMVALSAAVVTVEGTPRARAQAEIVAAFAKGVREIGERRGIWIRREAEVAT